MACSVTESKGYCWAEVLEGIAALEGGPFHVVALFDNAPTALRVWEAWRQALPDAITTATLYFEEAPPSGLPASGYGPELSQRVMRIQERLRQAFLATDETSCLFIECDQPPPPNLAVRLASHGKDIVEALTPARCSPTHANACETSDGYRNLRLLHQLKLLQGSLLEVDTVGLGCTLVQRRVLEMVGWENPKNLWDRFHNGGDVTLSWQFREQTGIRPFLDCGIVVPHVDVHRGRRTWHTYVDIEGHMTPSAEEK